DHEVVDFTAVVEPFVDNEGLLSYLRIEVAVEVRPPADVRVGDVHVGDAAVAELVDEPSVSFRPSQGPQSGLARGGPPAPLPRPRTVRFRPSLDRALPAGRRLPRLVNVLRRLKILAVHRQEVLAFFDVDARLGQRGAELRVPVLPVIDPAEPVP